MTGKEGTSGKEATAARLQKVSLLALVVGITILFLIMIRSFLVALILAGVFSAMARPVFLALAGWLGERRRTAAALTLLGLLILIVVPFGGFLAMVVAQAADVMDAAGPWIRQQTGMWEEWLARLEALPLVGALVPDQQALASGISDFAGRSGSFVLNNLSAATTGTVNVVLQLFVMFYAMYFFLLDGPAILARILYYAPLDEESEGKLIDRFVSVTRATIKGSILVGLIQGALAGAPFFILGLPGAAFWSMVMAVLSVIPVLGSGIVWAPAAVILISTGQVAEGIGLAVWGVIVVSSIDNVLRPRLVGRDTRMHDLLVLLSTFGGLAMFGLVGFMIGPIIAALFLTVWDLFGTAFGDILPGQPEPLPEEMG